MNLSDLVRVIRPLLVRLAEVESPHDGEFENCLLCGVTLPWRITTLEEQGTYDNRAHAADCPWRQARELVGIPLNRVEASDRERLGSWIPDDYTEWVFVDEGAQV